MSLLGVCEWLATTRGSVALHESLWGYPAVATVHVMALALSAGMIAIFDFRLVGVTMRHVRVPELAARLLPWAAGGFLVMVLSGLLLFYADPVRYYPNIFLRIKLLLLAAAGVNAWSFHRSASRNRDQWDLHPWAARRARVSGVLSLVLLASVILAGRMIAYYDEWFDCDRRPRSAIVTRVAGCVEPR